MQAIHIGGCGFWIGFGTTGRAGMLTYFPSKPSKTSCVHIFGNSPTASSHIGRESSGSMSNPPSSASVIERPVPTSTRPFDTMSSAAVRSAMRAGWLNGIGSRHTPCPTRMFSVRAATAVRKISGAEQCEYSTRKWCSTAHTEWNPRLSASTDCSIAWW